METCRSNIISILNNDDNPSFAVRPSRTSRYRTSTISYTHQQFHQRSPAAQLHNHRGDSSTVQPGSPPRFHVDSALSNHATGNCSRDSPAYYGGVAPTRLVPPYQSPGRRGLIHYPH